MIPNTNTTMAAAQAAIGFNTNPPPIWTSSPPLWQTAGMGRGLCNAGTPFFLIEEWFITIILS